MILQEYYINQFYITFHSIKRGKTFASVLFVLHLVSLVFLLLSQEVLDRIQKNDQRSFDSLRDSFHMDGTYEVWRKLIFGVSVAYNFILLFLLTVEVILYSRRKYERSDSWIIQLISFMFKIYFMVIFIPSLWSTMLNMPDPLSFINMVFTLFFAFAIEIHDYDYCLSSSNGDKLSRYQLNQVYVLKILLLFFITCNAALIKLDVQDILCLAYILFSFGSSLVYREYYDFQMRKLNFIGQIFYLLVVIVAILLRSYDVRVSFFFFMMAFIPMCLKFTLMFEQFFTNIEYGYINLKQWMELKEEKKILFYFQNVFSQLDKFSSIDYFLNSNSYVLEKIASDHVKDCKKMKNCFCYNSDKVTLANLSNQIPKSSSSSPLDPSKGFDDQQNKKFLLTHIDHYFKELRMLNLKKKKIGKLDFYYINFLIEQCGSRTNALYQIEIIKSQISTQSVYFKIYMKYLVNKAKTSFQDLDDRTQSCAIGLIFEETLQKAQDLFELCVILKLKLMSLLNSDFVDISSFSKFGVQLYQQRQILKDKLKNLAHINLQNDVLKNLIYCYLDLLAFIDTKQSIVDKKLQSSQQKKQKKQPIKRKGEEIKISKSELTESDKNQVKTSREFNPFDRNVCAIFLKMRNSDMGKIWRVQNSFSSIYGFKNPINQNINLIIPNAIHTIHNQKMKYFMSQMNVRMGQIIKYPLVIANTIEGFGTPIQLEVSIDHITQFNEIGMVVMTKVVNSDSHYVLLESNSRYLKTHLTTKDFYNRYLQQNFSVSEISSLEISRIIPLLNYQYFDTANNKTVQTLAFLPSNSTEGQQNKSYFKHQSSSTRKTNPLDLEYYSNNSNIDSYIVEYQLIRFNNDEFKCFILEIKNMQKIKKQKDISFELSLLKQNIDELLQNKDISNAFNLINDDINTNRSFREFVKLNDMQATQSKFSNQIQSSDRLFNNLLSPNSTAILDSRRSPSYSSNCDFFSPAAARRSNLINQLTDKAQEDYVTQLLPQSGNKQYDSLPFFQSSSKQVKQQQVGKYTQSVTSMNTIEQQQDTNLNKAIFNQKIDEQDDLDEGSNYQYKMKVNQSIRQKKGTLETMNLGREFSNSFNLPPLTTGREHLIQNNSTINQNLQNNMTINQNEENNGSPDMTQEAEYLENEERRRSYLQQLSPNDDNNKQDEVKNYDQNIQDNNSSMQGSSSGRDSNKKKSTRIREGQSSVHSSQSSTKEVLKTVEKKIMSLKSSFGLQILNIFGSFSVLIIVIMILIQFVDILKAFSKASIDFYFIQWPMELSSETSLIQYLQLIIRMNDNKVFPKMSSNWLDYDQKSREMILSYQTTTKKLFIDQMNCDYDFSPYFLQLTKTKVNWTELKDTLTYPRVKSQFKAGQSTFLQSQISTYNSLLVFTADSMNQDAILTENYDTFMEIIDSLKVDILDSAISSLKSIQSKVEILMILSISLSFCVICFIIPINAYIQGQREEVLKLFSTIPSQSIMKIATPCLNMVQLINDINHKNNSVKKSFRFGDDESRHQTQTTISTNRSQTINQNKGETEVITQTAKEIIIRSLDKAQKKKNISGTTSLPRYSPYLFLGGLIIFIIIIALPIANNLLSKKFKEEQITNINLLYSLYNLKDSFSETIFFAYSHIYSKFNLQVGGLYDNNFYQERIPKFIKENEVQIQEMISEVSKSQEQERYDNSDYDNFFYPVLQTDICKVLQDQPENTNNNKYQIDFSICDNPKNFMLRKGFQTASKHFFSQLHQAFDTSNSISQNYPQEIQQWQEDFDIKNFDDYFQTIMKVITTLKDFMEKKGKKYIDEMKLTEIVLTISQISLLLFVFYFGWISFYYKTSFQMNQTRRLLSLIDIQIIMENSYILSFLNRIK